MKLAPRPANDTFLTPLDALTFRFEDIPRLLRRVLDAAIAEHELSRTQWRLLAYVLREEGMTQTELARLLELERASVGQAIDTLEARELVERRQQPGDRRSWRIFPTAATRQLVPELRGVIDDIYGQMFNGFSDREVDQLHALLDRIMSNLED